MPIRIQLTSFVAIALVEIDGSIPAEVLAKVRQIQNVQQVKPLQF